MSADVTVAVVANGAAHVYHRNGRDLAQVAQFAVEGDVDPVAVAAAMADLGDLFGWHGAGGVVQPAGAGRVPRALPAPPAARPPQRRGRHASAQVDIERLAVLGAISDQPGIMRAALAQHLDISLSAVKRRTEELLRAGLIDARPLPGVRERGPGGGHGLFPVQQSPAQVS